MLINYIATKKKKRRVVLDYQEEEEERTMIPRGRAEKDIKRWASFTYHQEGFPVAKEREGG